MNITYPLLEGIESREESLQLFQKLSTSSAAELEVALLRASPLLPVALDGFAYVGYRKKSAGSGKEGEREKVIKGFVQLDDGVFGVYEVPAQQDDHPELWLPEYGQNGLIKLGVQGFSELRTEISAEKAEKLIVPYSVQFTENYYGGNSSSNVLVADTLRINQLEYVVEYLVLAKSRPIMDTVAKRIKAVLTAVREGKHHSVENPHERE